MIVVLNTSELEFELGGGALFIDCRFDIINCEKKDRMQLEISFNNELWHRYIAGHIIVQEATALNIL